MSHQTCSWSKYSYGSPTALPSKFFLSKEDAATLWKALQADKTDTEAILTVLPKRTRFQRLEIASEYQKQYNQNLIDDLKAKLSSDFENLIVALLTPLYDYYAEELHRAVKGLGTDEDDLIEVLCTMSNYQIKEIRRVYYHKYQQTLESDIKGDTSGYFRELLVTLCNAERNESWVVDYDTAYALAKSDAEELLNEKEKAKRWEAFKAVLCTRSYYQLHLTFEIFENLAGNTLEKTIEDDFSGDVEKGLLAIVESIKNKARFFAKRLNKSMKGLGTHDHDLIRLIVTRSEIDLKNIKEEYESLFSKTLAADIKGDTSGDYKKCLLILIGEE